MSDKTKHCGCESLRDQFAAAALTGLLVAHQEDAVDDVVRWSFNWADSMLAERAKLTPKSASVSNDEAPESKADAMPRTPETDRLTEWERHGSHRWGLGVASDLYDLECRVAALEKTIHDAVPAARAEAEVKEPTGSSTGCGEPESTVRTGDTPVTEPLPDDANGRGCATLGWRLLEAGEVIQEGDEWYSESADRWYPLRRWHGWQYSGDVGCVRYRRRVEPAAESRDVYPQGREPVAWCVMRVGGSFGQVFRSLEGAMEHAEELEELENWKYDAVPLYARLPKAPANLEVSEANGYAIEFGEWEVE
jgi:hypothetical protein